MAASFGSDADGNGNGNGPPEELKRRLPHDPRLYVRNFWQHPTRPESRYDFMDGKGENELTYLIDDGSHLNPKNWGDVVVLLFARGCLKTTSCVAITNWALHMYPNIEFTVTAPRRDQTSEIIDQFKKRARQSGLVNRRVRNKLSHQKFRTQHPTKDIELEADLKSRSAWGEGDALRGIHSHGGVIDEFQDVDEGMFSTFLEAIDQSHPEVPYFPTIFVIGTPKMANTFFHELWSLSDQKDWDTDQEAWVPQTEAQSYVPDGAPEDADGFQVTGWHIDQHACPLHEPDTIAFKEQTYSPKKYQNEVLAEFYSPESDMLTDGLVFDVLNEDMAFRERRQYDPDTSRIVLGVDWGGGSGKDASDTVVVVGEYLPQSSSAASSAPTEGGRPSDHFTVCNIDFLDPSFTKSEETRRVEDYILQYDADRVVVDEGHGAKQREDLQDGNDIRNGDGYDFVHGCHYGNVKDKEGVTWKSDKKRQFTVNRTHMMQWLVSDIKDHVIEIPAAGMSFGSTHTKGRKLVNQLTAPYTHADETPNGTKKLKVQSDRKDDAFHAMTYMWIAAKKLGSQRTLRSIVTHDRY